ncbi:MAG: hypothetical protein HY234_05305 [Acidobacteria bacterium]|nr:hypothetical protein [Acidobacteriota bacterium]MBI3662451.1 hypothetical protein [Acidobacteriota bacterium]
MAQRMKKVSTKPVGKAIQRAIKQLKAVRATATPRGKKEIDLHIRALKRCHANVRLACKGTWVSPSS